MKNKTKLIIIAAILVILLVGAGFIYDSLSDSVDTDKLANSETDDADRIDAPDFTVYDADGNAVKLSDFRGRPVVINFWASWCGVCKAEMPDFETVYKEYGDRVEFLMINVTDGYQETMESAQEFLATVDYTFPIYYDTSMQAGVTYAVSGLPTSYFINANGKLVGRANYLDLATLHEAIGSILD